MKKHQNTLLTKWYRATENLAQMFAIKYFGKDASDTWWVADDVGGVYVINDYFFEVGDMVEFLREGYGKDRMFEYMDYALKIRTDGGHPLNIKAYKMKP
jgi:hypothetical protein